MTLPHASRWSLPTVFSALTAVSLLLLAGPSLVLLMTSFTSTESLRFPPDGLSLRWYVALLESTQMQRAAWNSLVVAAWSTLICAVLGTAAALAITGSDARWARAAEALFMSSLLLPALAFGFASLIYVNLLGLTLSLPVLVIAHSVVCVPFVLRTTIAALTQLPASLLDASASLGANNFTTFRRVLLPLIGRGVGAGAFLAFMASFDNVPVSLFLANERIEMLPIHLWQQIENNLDVRTAAVSCLIMLLTLAAMLVAERAAGISRQFSRQPRSGRP